MSWGIVGVFIIPAFTITAILIAAYLTRDTK